MNRYFVTFDYKLQLNQWTLNNLKEFHNPNCSEFTGVQMLFRSCFHFAKNNKGASDWGTEAWRSRNNSKQRNFAWEFQLVTHQLSFFKFKKPLKIMCSEQMLFIWKHTVFIWYDWNEIRSVSWASLPSTWPKSNQAEEHMQYENFPSISTNGVKDW